MHVHLGYLSGRLVLDATGTILGRTKAPLVDMETWLIDALRVTLSRQAASELDLAWSFWWWKRPTIDIPTGVVQAAGEAILLRVSLGELHDSMPEPIEAERMASIH